METLIIIPARMGSKRFPGKPLKVLAGKPLLQWTYEAAIQVKDAHVLIASPDREVCQWCQSRGILWRPTREDHLTGTHRCAEVLNQIKDDAKPDIVVNWQCDEPLADPRKVEEAIEECWSYRVICTLTAPQSSLDEGESFVSVAEENQVAHWFSRAYLLGGTRHCGVYVFPASILREIGRLEPTVLSRIESLEQLTWVQQGYTIRTVALDELYPAVNCKSDLIRVGEILKDAN